MFNKILIANRGEIACRVIRTAKRLGLESVAIFSSADRDSEHVKQADEAYYVGDAAAKDSYLHIDAIIAIAQKSGAQAIHPGYGFLSENVDFARACEKANLIFIGPGIAAIEAMGSKQLAKQLLEKTSVPLTPGYHGADQSDQRLLQEAEKIGFPVLLKAANGGGGKGMRAVYSADQFPAELAGARREAKASFADDTMIIEKLVTNPRHIEVQIMADNHGNVVHLFERDCSIQRRHQKIIEEAPAPAISQQLRDGITQAACEVARSIHYRGAGTVEFLVDSEEQFYFMEMNTRLQVEHPVTEMITDLDLVAWQIHIAENLPLPLKQDQISKKGHAIECRIYAEDPTHDFMPSIGQLHFLKEPTGQGIRIDTGVARGSSITMHYDPMIAKLIVYGETRPEAIYRLQQALKRYAIGGVKTNIAFLRAIAENHRFMTGKLCTDFLKQEQISLPAPDRRLSLMMAAAYQYLKLNAQQDPLFQQSFAWQMHLKSHWQWRYLVEKEIISVKVEPINHQQFTLTVGDHPAQTLHATHHAGKVTLDDGEKIHTAWVEANEPALYCYLETGPVLILEQSSDEDELQTTQHSGQMTAPMPATVVAVLKKAGDPVKEGEQIMVLEAMKMEHAITAPRDGIVAELYYSVGAQVQEGAELLALED